MSSSSSLSDEDDQLMRWRYSRVLEWAKTYVDRNVVATDYDLCTMMQSDIQIELSNISRNPPVDRELLDALDEMTETRDCRFQVRKMPGEDLVRYFVYLPLPEQQQQPQQEVRIQKRKKLAPLPSSRGKDDKGASFSTVLQNAAISTLLLGASFLWFKFALF